MLREVCSRYSVFCAVSLSILVFSAPVKAQVINNQTNYNSLTAIAGNNKTATDVTANIIANTGHDLDPNKNATGKAAYAYQFGVNATTEGATDIPGSVANLSGVGGGNTLSTILVADDLQLQVNTTSHGNSSFNNVSVNDIRFLVSNHNASALTVDAHLRIFDDDATVGGNGGFPGTLLKSYDISGINLNGNGGGYASATQVSVPSSALGSNPLSIGFNQFNQVGLSAGHYRTRLWVGLFFTADASTVTSTELAQVGGVIYDPNAGPNDATSYTPTTDFSVDGIGIGTSDDQFDGDDIDRAHSKVGPTANYNTGTHTGYDDNFTAFAFTSLFTAASLDNSGHGPEANLTWLFGGNVVLTPEPGSFGLLAIGGLPFVALIRRRKR